MERPASRRKKKHKGVQCRRGKPLYYGEIKQHCNLMLTQTALDKLEELALSSNISRSEVIEQWLRSQIQQTDVPSQEQRLDAAEVDAAATHLGQTLASSDIGTGLGNKSSLT